KCGTKNWNRIPKISELNRNVKSCRLRCMDHFEPNLKKGMLSFEEILKIITLHKTLENQWLKMAKQ
ncbi:hypothetical protein S83_041146, partial [Arachis hypogaea]